MLLVVIGLSIAVVALGAGWWREHRRRAATEQEVRLATRLDELKADVEELQGRRRGHLKALGIVAVAGLADQARHHPRVALVAVAGIVALALALPGIIGGGDGEHQERTERPAPNTPPPTAEIPREDPGRRSPTTPSTVAIEVSDPGTSRTTSQPGAGQGAAGEPIPPPVNATPAAPTTIEPEPEPMPVTAPPASATTTTRPGRRTEPRPPPSIVPGNGDEDDDEDDEEATSPRECLLGLDLRDIDLLDLLCNGLPV